MYCAMQSLCCYIICLRSALTYSDTPEGRGNSSILMQRAKPCSHIVSSHHFYHHADTALQDTP